jgi:hypothetical protein
VGPSGASVSKYIISSPKNKIHLPCIGTAQIHEVIITENKLQKKIKIDVMRRREDKKQFNI